MNFPLGLQGWFVSLSHPPLYLEGFPCPIDVEPIKGRLISTKHPSLMSGSGYKQTCGEVRQSVRSTPESGHSRRWCKTTAQTLHVRNQNPYTTHKSVTCKSVTSTQRIRDVPTRRRGGTTAVPSQNRPTNGGDRHAMCEPRPEEPSTAECATVFA